MNDQHKVVVYSTPTCPYCHQAKRYLTEKGVSYVEKDVATDLEARDEMVRKSGQLGVPVIEVNGSVIIGFNRPKLDELLAA
jgi:glutaredoxin-like YruB-family protein